MGHELPILENRKVEKKRSPPHPNVKDSVKARNSSLVDYMPRDCSFSDLNKKAKVNEEENKPSTLTNTNVIEKTSAIQISLGPISGSTDRYTSNPELSRNAEDLLVMQAQEENHHPMLEKKKSASTDNLNNENSIDNDENQDEKSKEIDSKSQEHDKKKYLNSPLIKVSHSESSLKSHTILQPNESSRPILPFKKLGLAFSNNKENRQQSLRDLAKSRKENSQLQYKDLNCTILLL